MIINTLSNLNKYVDITKINNYVRILFQFTTNY